jgi:choline dehydrogenase-like flavoprotein
VLFVEAGSDRKRPGLVEATPGFGRLTTEEQARLLREGGRAWEPLGDARRGDSFVPYTGSGTGGSSALYGMVMERFFPVDFERWPVSYEEMAPWYAAAERLYRVRGGADALRGQGAETLLEPPPLSAANRKVFEHLERQGLHPYRLHLACERVAGCQLCRGFQCGGECKNDARRICLEPAVKEGRAELLVDCPVSGLEVTGRRVTGVLTPQGKLTGRVVVVAAGALKTPGLMPERANRSGQVGRNLMRHLIDLFVLRKAPRIEQASEAKELGLSDFCLGREQLGHVQSFGLPPPWEYLRHQPGRNIWRWLGPLGKAIARYFAGTPIVAGITEDLPRGENGIKGNEIRYEPGVEDERRRVRLRRRIEAAFGGLGAIRAGGTEDRKGLGHVCGTCRFGDNPATSVLDRWNRAHEFDNLYVVDASFFPSSGRVNPALTVAANALRVAAELERRL